MIYIKPIIFYPNNAGCEATWVDHTQASDIEIAEVLATFDEEGNELTPFIPSRTEAGAIEEIQVKCHSYHPTQMDMLRADAFELNTSLVDYEDQITNLAANYIPPPPEPIAVPQVITIRQAKLVLLSAGLLDDVDVAVSQAPRSTQIEWEYATEVNRTWPTLLALQSILNLSDSEIDNLFIEGSKL